MQNNNLVMLVVLDGFGLSPSTYGNAIAAAHKPNLDKLFQDYPFTTLNASGEDVGLPAGQMGNSEVGHLNLGAGRIVYQSLTRVNIAVKNRELEKVPAIARAIDHSLQNNSKLHIMGLLSDGGVHSHIDHILYLLEAAVNRGVKEVVVHAFLDGRDVPPKSAKPFLKQLQEKIDQVGKSKIGVISGRYYAMDRDRNFNRIQKTYDALVYNQAPLKDYLEGIDESYAQGITDEFLIPFIANKDSNINNQDSVVFANFRPDRAIEISTALTNPDLVPLENKKYFEDLFFVQMMLYSENVRGEIAFDLQELKNTYGEVISNAGLKQLRIAETEKYAHVTYFFDGGEEKDLPGATRILIPSPKVATYDLQPEMSGPEVTEKVIEAIASREYDTIILNFANCDMVGHTAVFDAAVKAVEAVDSFVGRIKEKVDKVGGVMVIIADHGNADKIYDEDGRPFSAHTSNPVPCVITKKGLKLRSGGNLGDVAPTMLDLLGITQPVEMTGKTLIKK